MAVQLALEAARTYATLGQATLRMGRQEFSFGSGRLVTQREGANVRLAADAARVIWRKGGVRIDSFYARPAVTRAGTFDNRSSAGLALWGAYVTAIVEAPLGADIYYLGYRNADSLFAAGAGSEMRHSIGVRLFGADAKWDWDIKGVVQFGRFDGGAILAWTIASDTGYTFEMAWSPRIALKADVASGDRGLADGKLQTFNALFPKLPYFSDANLVAPANFIDLHPYLTLQPTTRLNITIGWNALWRCTTRDAVYVPPSISYPDTAGQNGRFIGSQVIGGLDWKIAPNLDVSTRFVHFWVGDAVASAGGRDTDFLYISAGWKF